MLGDLEAPAEEEEEAYKAIAPEVEGVEEDDINSLEGEEGEEETDGESEEGEEGSSDYGFDEEQED